MDISKFSIEDFVYDPDFRKWVLHPNLDSDKLWKRLLSENPSQQPNITHARKILLRMSAGKDELYDGEFEEIWANVDSGTRESSSSGERTKIIPLNPVVRPGRPKRRKNIFLQLGQFYRIAAILVIAFGLGIVAADFFKVSKMSVVPDPVVYEEHVTPRGVKSDLTLGDGSKVILNSGSSIKYIKGFEKDKREVFLEGEAYFDVAKDAERPFTVRKANVSVTALGTSFNVRAYENEDLNISLISGKVGIEMLSDHQQYVLLEQGESLQVRPEGTWSKGTFNEEEVIGWTKKMIVFNKTPVPQAIRILENWYGVTFNLENEPHPGLLLSGRFENETLQNVLEGLSYTTKLEFEMKDEVINIKF